MTNSGTNIIKYEAARLALAEARSLIEVKDVRDKASSMTAWAKLAKDRDLIEQAIEIRIRAEIRAGQMLREMAERKEREVKGGNRKSKSHDVTLIQTPKLTDLGISKMQSSRWQKIASLPHDTREQKIANAKRRAVAIVEPTERKQEAKKETATKKTKNGKTTQAVVADRPSWSIDRVHMWLRTTVLEALNEIDLAEWPEFIATLREEVEALAKIMKEKERNATAA